MKHVPDVGTERHGARVRDAEQGDDAPVGAAFRCHADDERQTPHVRVEDDVARSAPVDVDVTGPATDIVKYSARVHGIGRESAAQLDRPRVAAAPREAKPTWPGGAAIVTHG